MERLKKLRLDQWAWVHAKIVIIVWGILFQIYTPAQVDDVLGMTLVRAVSAVTIIGLIISLTGMYMSMSNIIITASRGITIELSGLWLAIAGPLAFSVTQLYLSFGPDGNQQISRMVLPYGIAAFFFVRITLISAYRRRNR